MLFRKIISGLWLTALLCCIQVQAGDTLSVKNPSGVEKAGKLNDLAFSLRKTDPARSLAYSRLALSLSLNEGYTTGQINALLLMGMVYKNISAFDKAADAYFTALRLAENSGDKKRISSCLNNIGSVFQAQENYDKALYYYQRSMKIEEELNDKAQKSIRLYNIGVVCEAQGKIDKAYAYYSNSLLIEESTGNKEGIYYALYGLAGVETKMGRYESAMGNITRALKVARELNDALGISVCHCETGKLYMALGNYKQAVNSFDSSLHYASPGKLLNEMKDGYENLSNAWMKLGNTAKSLENLQQYVKINDSLNSLGIKSRVAELETRFEVDKKDREIDNLKELNRLKEANTSSERRTRTYLLITIILAMLMAIYNLRRIAVNMRRTLLLAAAILVSLCFISLGIQWLRLYPDDTGFFRIFADVLTYSVLPLFALILITERILLARYLKKAVAITEEIKQIHIPENEAKITLVFDGKESSVTLTLSELICFEAADNYITLYFLKNGQLKKEMRRITLKKVEEQLSGNSEIVRCHKSFIINISKVTHVSGNAQGYKLHLQQLDFAIPVSRRFPQAMIDALKKKAE